LRHYAGALKAAVIERSGETGGGTPKSPCWKVKNHGRGRRATLKRKPKTEGSRCLKRGETGSSSPLVVEQKYGPDCRT
jgi:hypothetical protein